MAAASFGAQTGAAAGDVYASYVRAKSDKAQAEMDARQKESEAALEEDRALDASRRGSARFMRFRMAQSQQVGAERARIAAKGGAGALALSRRLADLDFVGEIDAKTTLTNTEKEVWLIRQNARARSFDAQMLRAIGRGISPRTRAVGSLISGAGKVAKSYYGFGGSEGIFGRSQGDQLNVFNRPYGDE